MMRTLMLQLLTRLILAAAVAIPLGCGRKNDVAEPKLVEKEGRPVLKEKAAPVFQRSSNNAEKQ